MVIRQGFRAQTQHLRSAVRRLRAVSLRDQPRSRCDTEYQRSPASLSLLALRELRVRVFRWCQNGYRPHKFEPCFWSPLERNAGYRLLTQFGSSGKHINRRWLSHKLQLLVFRGGRPPANRPTLWGVRQLSIQRFRFWFRRLRRVEWLWSFLWTQYFVNRSELDAAANSAGLILGQIRQAGRMGTNMIENRTLTMDDYAAMLRRRFKLILIPTLLAPLVGFLISYAFPRSTPPKRWFWWKTRRCRKGMLLP